MGVLDEKDAFLYHVKLNTSLRLFKNETKAAAGANVMVLGALLQFQGGGNWACCSLGVSGKLLMTAQQSVHLNDCRC